MTVTDHIRARLLARVDCDDLPDLPVLRETEWCPEFERLRSNRLVMGAFRYGRLGAAGKPAYDRIECAANRLHKYQVDLNAEHLVDVANMMMLEFVEGTHNGVIATDDGEHTKTK